MIAKEHYVAAGRWVVAKRRHTDHRFQEGAERFIGSEPSGARRGDPIVGDGDEYEPRNRGEVVEAAGTEVEGIR
jgi:hypothetical protein